MHHVRYKSEDQMRTASKKICEWTFQSSESISHPISKLQSNSECVCAGE